MWTSEFWANGFWADGLWAEDGSQPTAGGVMSFNSFAMFLFRRFRLGRFH